MRWSIVILLILTAPPCVAGPLGDALETRVEQWLEAIEDHGVDPLAVTGPPPGPREVEGRPRLALARSIRTFEAELDSTGAITRGDVLPLLVLARHYAQLGLPRPSLRWYNHAYLADGRSQHLETILVESTGVALASAESTLVLDQTWRLARRADAPRYSDQLARLVAASERVGGAGAVTPVVEHLADRFPELGVELATELAWQRQKAGQLAEAHRMWRALLEREESPPALAAARILRGLADTAALNGNHELAYALYRRTQIHDTGLLSAWSTYQLAGIAAARGQYDPAIRGFRSLCEREQDTPWKAESCWRLQHALSLEAIDDALAAYRRALHGR